jgi:hypothetical protein
MNEIVFARYQSHSFASPLGQGERIEVRGQVAIGHRSLRATLTVPLSHAKGEGTLVSARVQSG